MLEHLLRIAIGIVLLFFIAMIFFSLNGDIQIVGILLALAFFAWGLGSLMKFALGGE